METVEPIPSSDNDSFKSARFRALMEEKEKFDEEISAAESKFQETVQVVKDSPLFAKFLSEYEKMYGALGKSKEHIEKLVLQFQDLENQFLYNASQTDSVNSALNSDASVIKSLKAEIKEAENQTMQFTKREDDARNELRQTKVDILNLTNTIKQGVGLSAAQEKNLYELTHSKESMTKDIEVEMDKIVNLRARISEISDKNRLAELTKRNLDTEIFNLKEKNAIKKGEIDSEVRNKDRLENELRELRVLITVKSQEVKNKQDAVNRATDDIAILESHIKNQKLLLEKLNKDQDSLENRTTKLKDDYFIQYKESTRFTEENEVLFKQLKEKEADLAMHRAEMKRISKVKESLIRKNRKAEEEKVLVELERKELRQSIAELSKKVDEYKRNVDAEKKNIEDLIRERDIINNNQAKIFEDSQYQTSVMVILKHVRHNMNLDILRLNKEIEDYSQKILQYQNEKEELIKQAIEMQEACVKSIGTMKEKEVSLYEFQKEISACETKIQYQQNLYESVLSDKKLHAKHLLDAQAEIVEMKRKLKIMNFSINGSKEEIYAKETAKQKEAAELAKITKEIDGIHDEIKNLKSQQELAQSYIRTQVSEQSKLANFAKEAEMEKIREEKALNSLVSERDNLSAQLMRQNDELTKVYDRIKTVQSSLNRGEIYYNEKCKTIRNITLEILDLKNQYRSLVLETGNLADLKKHLTNVEEELTQGQIRFKALEEQLKYPMNIHRWRKMESSNPQEFELMKMIQCLQKKLISLSKDDHEKQSLISKKEELYLHLKELLAKQVGPEAMEQIEEYETVLKDKNLQLKHMSAELNMYQAQVREYRYSISQADKSLEELKKEIMERYNAQMSEAKYAKAKKPTRIKSAIKKTSDSSSQQLGQAPSNGMGPDSASLESETQSKAAETPQPAPDNGIDAPSGQTDAPSGQTDASSVYTEDVPASEPVLNETNDSS